MNADAERKDEGVLVCYLCNLFTGARPHAELAGSNRRGQNRKCHVLRKIWSRKPPEKETTDEREKCVRIAVLLCLLEYYNQEKYTCYPQDTETETMPCNIAPLHSLVYH